jgi:general secretion pathway protein K
MWALMILTLFSISISYSVQRRVALLSRLQTLDALYPVAYSGVEFCKSLIVDDSQKDIDTFSDSWANVSASRSSQLKNGSFVIGDGRRSGMVDEESKVSLNKAKPDVLARLLQQVANVNKDEAEELAYCLIDWMDSDSFFGHPNYGAEDSYYESLDKPYSAKDSKYEQLDEMLLVSGMNQDIFEAIKPYVTVYGMGHINLNTASKPVLLSLGLSSELCDKIVRYRSGPDGKDGTGDDQYFQNLPTLIDDLDKSGGTPTDLTQRTILDGLSAAGDVALYSSVFSARIVAHLERNNASVELDAVIDRKGKVKLARSSGVLWPAR